MIIGLGLSIPEVAVRRAASGLANAETTTWVNAVVGDGGTVSAGRQTTVDTLISSLKSSSVWTKIDRLPLFAAENSQSALREIKTAALMTLVNAPTFSADHGYTGNGTTSYIDSNFTPSTAGGQYTQNAAHLGGYILTSRTTSNAYAVAGTGNAAGTEFDYVISRYSDGQAYGSLNAGSGAAIVANANAQGQYIVSRNSSSNIDLYKNGNTTPIVSSAASNSVVLSDASILFLGRRASGVLADPSADQIAAGYFGGTLSSAEMASVASAINTYMTALGVNVY